MTNLRHTTPIALGLFLGSLVGCGGGTPSSGDGASDKTKADAPAGDAKEGDAKAEQKPEPSKPEKRTWKKFDGGKAPFTISGWEGKFDALSYNKKDRVFLSLDYKLKVEKKMKMGDRIDFKGTCKVGDKYFADLTTAMLGLQDLEPGETKQTTSSIFAMTGLPGKPEKCQITVLFISGDDLDPYLAGEYCFDGKAVADGPCKDFSIERPSGVVARIQDLDAKVRKIKFGQDKGKKELWVEFAVVPGKLLDSEAVFMKTSCKIGDEKIVNEVPTAVSMLKFVDPGESFRVTTDAYGGQPLASDPSSCEFKFVLRTMFDSDGDKIGTFCFKDGKVSEGAC